MLVKTVRMPGQKGTRQLGEKSLRSDLKAIGAHWSPGDRLWYAPEEYVRRIGLVDRIVKRG